MANVTFARPRHVYDSYTDLYRLIELSGYPLIHFDEIDPQSDNLYVMTLVNGENMHGWERPRASIVLWDLEWRLDGNYPQIPGVKRTWASDRWYAGQIGAEYVPLGSHVGLAHDYPHVDGKEYDLALMMYLGPYRRNNLVNQLQANGLRIAPNGWGQERHDILCQSRAMLHIHQHDDIRTIAPLRWALAAAYGLPMFSESVRDTGLLSRDMMVEGAYENLRRLVCDWLQRYDAQCIEEKGRALHEFLCKTHTFRSLVEAAV